MATLVAFPSLLMEHPRMLKILLWIIGIIFLIGLLVVSGILGMIF